MKTEIKLTQKQFVRWLECPDILEMSDDNKWAHLVAETSRPELVEAYGYVWPDGCQMTYNSRKEAEQCKGGRVVKLREVKDEEV